MTRHRLLLPSITNALLLGLFLSSRPVRAQRLNSSADAIPRELAAALATDGTSAVPDFVVGGVPPILADRIPTLAGARVLGSMLTSTTATIAISLPLRADSARALLVRELPNRGWRAGPIGGGGGFRPASARSPSMYCADGRMLSFLLSTPSYGTTLVKLVIRDGYAMCPSARGELVSFVTGSSFGSSMPTLVNPQETGFQSGSCRASGSPFGQVMSTSVRVPMTSQELLEFYAKQLTDSGFAVQRPDTVRMIERTFVRRAAPPNVTSSIGQIPAATQMVTLRVSDQSSPSECRTVRMEISTIFDR